MQALQDLVRQMRQIDKSIHQLHEDCYYLDKKPIQLAFADVSSIAEQTDHLFGQVQAIEKDLSEEDKREFRALIREAKLYKMHADKERAMMQTVLASLPQTGGRAAKAKRKKARKTKKNKAAVTGHVRKVVMGTGVAAQIMNANITANGRIVNRKTRRLSQAQARRYLTPFQNPRFLLPPVWAF
jgi:hypothetical protein